jgi:hypothetical protein
MDVTLLNNQFIGNQYTSDDDTSVSLTIFGTSIILVLSFHSSRKIDNFAYERSIANLLLDNAEFYRLL